MKIHVLSDLHIEFGHFQYPECNADVVVLAGDIHVRDKGVIWAMENIPHIPVVYVMGNHEYYGSAYPKLVDDVKEKTQGSNVHVLENDSIKLDGINFIGCTLWTNFELFGNPEIIGYECQQLINDYKKIRRWPSYSKLRSIDVASIHLQSFTWLNETLLHLKDEKNIVVTHHAPSIKSLPEFRKNKVSSAAYASNLETFVAKHKPDYWIHGHVHSGSEYFLGDCKVVCNPKGYPDENITSYDPLKCINI